MRFAPEGAVFIWSSLLVALAVAGASALGVGRGSWWIAAAVLLTALNAVFVAFFFRDPVRIPPEDESLVVAPGDGRIVEITEVEEPSFMGGKARRISIFLSVFNVHVQRAPVSGTVEHREYRKGAFQAAWSSHASLANEQSSLGLDGKGGRVLVRQIAGLVARRIVTDHEVGDTVVRGDRIGLIRFGSRVDTFLPLDWPLECAVGQKAVAGSSVLARRPEDGDGAEASAPGGDGAGDVPDEEASS